MTGFALDGLVSGLGTSDLINQLIQLERAPQLRLVQKRDRANRIVQGLQVLNTKLTAVRTSSRQMADPQTWLAMKATSSADAVATATATTKALPGTLTFNVTQLAKAGGMASSGTVASLDSVVYGGSIVFSQTDPTPLGIQTISAGSGVTSGDHTVTVTQASAAAVKTGSTPLAATTNIPGGQTSLNVTVNGVAQTWTIAANNAYTSAQLVSALQAAATAAGANVTVGLSANNAIQITTRREGSSASIQVTGGGLASRIGLDIDATAITGTNAIVEVDGQVHTITDARAGLSYNLASATGGSFDLTLAGGLRTGTWSSSMASTGGGTLSEVVAGINSADLNYTAAAVKVADGAYRLQLTAKATGVENDLTVAADMFSTGPLGMLLRTSSAADATITIGDGPGAYSVSSATNTMTDVLEGVSLTVKTLGSTTVSVNRDAERLADGIKNLVDMANAALNDIKQQTSYNTETKQSGVLMANYAVRSLQSNLIGAFTSEVAASSLGAGGAAGVSMTRTGTLTFDRTKFLDAYARDPGAVADLFQRTATATDSRVTVMATGDRTVAGSYDVVVTQAATAATAVGTAPAGGTIASGETIDIVMNGKTVTYAAAAGDSVNVIAAGLSSALGAAGLDLTATVEAGALVLRSGAYGTAATFQVRSTASGAGQTGLVTAAGVYEAHAGLDVAGTINGVDGTGSGRLLTAPGGDPAVDGVVLRIDATAAEVVGPTALGTFTFTAAIAQRVTGVINAAIDTVSGTITAAIEGRQTEAKRLDDRVAEWDDRLERRTLALRRKFAAMETALSSAKAQQSWLAGQLAGLQANSTANR